MNLLWHQVFKDLRMTRVLVGMFYAVLLGDLAISQEWIGAPIWEWPYDRGIRDALWQTWPPLMLMMFGAIITLSIVVTDTPARDNGFLRTRPVPVRTIWWGKVIFITLFVITPSLAELTLHLLLSKVAGPDFAGILLDRVCLILPAALLIAGVSACTVSTTGAQGNIVSLTIAFVFGMALLGATVMAARFLPGIIPPMNPEPTRLRICCAMALAGLGLLGASVWIVRRHPSDGRRTLVTGLIGMLSLQSFLIVPPSLSVTPLAQGEINRFCDAHRFTVPPGGIQQGQSAYTQNRPSGSRSINLSLDAPEMPIGWALEARPSTVTLKNENGARIRSTIPWPRDEIFRHRGYPNAGDVRSIHSAFPEAQLLHVPGVYHLGSQTLSLNGGEIVVPENPPWQHEPVELSVLARAHVYQWELAARLPLTQLATSKDTGGEWRIDASRYDTNSESWHVILKRTQIWRELTRNQERRQFGSWPANQYQFLFFDPETRTVMRNQRYPARIWSTGHHNGAGSAHVQLSHMRDNRDKPYLIGDTRNFELLILKRMYLGELESPVAKTLRLEEIKPGPGGTDPPRGDALPRSVLLRRFHALAAPATDAGRPRVAQYVAGILQLISASQEYLDENDELILALARFVPTRTELFLDGLEASSGPTQRALEKALNVGLTAAQKGTLIARLRRNPGVCKFLMNHGWLEDARNEVLALTDSPRRLDRAALEALAFFVKDPRAAQRLLTELEFGSNTDAYDLLARQPAMAESLDETVRRMWSTHVPLARFAGQPSDVLHIATRHGIQEAHAQLLDLFRRIQPEQRKHSYQLLASVWESTELPGLSDRDRHDHTRLAKEIARIADQTFRFDTARKRFALVRPGTEGKDIR